MDISKIKGLTIGNLTAKVPIIQGGMGIGISLSGLAVAVAEEEAIGVISAAGIGMGEKDILTNYLEASRRGLINEIAKAREKTKGILGVNIMVAMTNFADMVKTAINEKIDIIFSGAGLPLSLPSFLKESCETKLVPIVSSARGAALIAKRWIDKYKYAPDAIVVEGPKAGGHLGYNYGQIDDPKFLLEDILTEVIDIIKPFEEKCGKAIPVIAAGGIFTGEDIYKFIKMGASGVQMATRFVATEECDASIEFKNTYVTCKEEDIGIIKSPVGMPGRAIYNDFILDINKGAKKPFSCPFHCLSTCDYKEAPYCISLALFNAKKGNLKNGFVFAGANAYRVDKIVKVHDLIEELINGYNEAALIDRI